MDKEYQEFKELIKKMKEEKFDSEKTKEYILKIKKYLDRFMNNCNGEISKEEALQQFLDKYNDEIKKRTTTTGRLMYGVSQYNACKVLLNLSKSNKIKFNNLIQTAKRLERENKTEPLDNSLNTEKQLIITLRTASRHNVQMTEKGLQAFLKVNKSYYEKALKEEFIKRIEECVLYLNEYGTLDELIESVNVELEKLNLEGIKIRKRNPLPDEIKDEEGNIIKYNEKGQICKFDKTGKLIKDEEDLFKYEEDPGLMEILDEENLQNMSVENLLFLDAFWRAKHLEERGYISNAIVSIEFLELWDTILNEEQNVIESLDEEKISNALKRDKALTYIYGNVDKITPKMKRQYSKFLKDNNMVKKGKIEDDLKVTTVELENILALSKDISLESCVIISKLMEKDFDIKNWGIINESELGNGKKELGILIDNPNLRAPILMGMPDNMIKAYFQNSDLKLPRLKNPESAENDFNAFMSEICLPVTPYFKKYMTRKYLEDPSSEVFAKGAGRKVKNKEESVLEK